MKRYLLLLAACAGTTFAYAQNYGYSNKDRIIEPSTGAANLEETQRVNLHMQATYILQYKPSFKSPYQGFNSLDSNEDHQNSLTATLFFGARLWKGGEVYINPELAAGSGLSGAVGMGGSSNGETFRVGNPAPTLYLGRAYLRQTFSLGSKQTANLETVGDGQNQLAGYEPKEYLRFYLGKLSLADLFDNNAFSNSPRMQFMNWALMNNGAWDYAANTRGYTYAFAAEVKKAEMKYKLVIAALPEEANGPELNTNLYEVYAINGQVERSINIGKRPGNIRLLGYYNTANLGNYENAIELANATNTEPSVNKLSKAGASNNKFGIGLNFDQQLTDNLGLFGRIGWNDGNNQTWCFTEIDHTLSLGLSANGKGWGRDDDNLGFALVANGLSDQHRKYLALGGYGFILGDGALNYAPEGIAEAYYSFKPFDKDIWFSGDYQFCVNPGYNADRGPVHIFSLRVHAEL
jgi:high affinity Mn2+ porin